MSQFISNTINLESPPIFSLSTKQIVMPRIKKFIRGKPQDQVISYRKQSKLLNNICQRLQKQEFEQIHKQNAKQMEAKFEKLKKRMNKRIHKESVEDILNSKQGNQKLNIRQIVKMRPHKIELQKKYGNIILLRMQNYKEAEQICKLKQRYRKWYDSEKNDRCNSPIFKKMNYLLERATKQDILDQLLIHRIQRHTTNQGKQNNRNEIFTSSLNKNNSAYKKKQIDWSLKREKFSLLNPNYEY